jgi:hypothetical protein
METLIFDVNTQYADEMRIFLFAAEVKFTATLFTDPFNEECYRFRVTGANSQQAFNIGLKYSSLLLNAGVSYLLKQFLF